MATRTDRPAETTNRAAPNIDSSNGWRPEPGDVLVGKVVGGAVGNSEWGPYPIYTLATDSEPGNKDAAGPRVDVHCFHDQLQRQVMDLRPQAGERVRITYIGETRTKDEKRTVNLYTVEVAGRIVDPAAAMDRLALQRSISAGAPVPAAAPVAAPVPQAVPEPAPAQRSLDDQDIPF